MNKFIGSPTFICAQCGRETVRNSNRQKYCSDCSKYLARARALEKYYEKADNSEYRERNREYCRAYYRGERRGYNQKGENNNNWKGGAGYYQQFRGSCCERCGSTEFLVVHHRDHNHYNNSLENLETLCKSCHQVEHEVWKNFTKGIVRSSEKEESGE